MWIKFGGKLTQTGEYTEFAIEHEISWDEIMLRSDVDYLSYRAILEVTFVNPRIRLIKTMLNPVLDRVDTRYDNKIHKDISKSHSSGSHSSLLSCSSYSSSSYSENTVVERKGKTDKYRYRENCEIVELNFPKETLTTYRGEIFKLSLQVNVDLLEKTLTEHIGDRQGNRIHWWLVENSNSFSTHLYEQDHSATSAGMTILPKLYPELDIEVVFHDFIEAEKDKAMTELAKRLNKGLEGV